MRAATEAGQAAWRAPGASAAGIVRSGPGAGRDVRRWENRNGLFFRIGRPRRRAAGGGLRGARQGWRGSLPPRGSLPTPAALRSLGHHARAAVALVLAVVATALPVQAQTQTPVQLVSTLAQENTGSNPGPFGLYDAAQAFTTGTDTNGYKLTSVGLRLHVEAGTSGWVYSVSVWSATATGSPDTSLGTLTNPTLETGTTAFTNYTFTESGNGIDLDASTTYVIVVDVTTIGTTIIDVAISNTVSDDEDTGKAAGWSIADDSLYRDWDSTGAWTTFDQTRRISVTGTPNNPPTSAEQLVDADEDTDYTFTADDFGFADTDAGDSLVSVKIVTLPASGEGTLTLSGTAIGSGDLPQTVPAAEIDDLKYSPPANLYGKDVASFTFKVNDGTVDSDDAYTMIHRRARDGRPGDGQARDHGHGAGGPDADRDGGYHRGCGRVAGPLHFGRLDHHPVDPG